MEQKLSFRGGYETPVSIPVEVSSEGVLCQSLGNENFNIDGPAYGDGSETNGWK